MSKKNKILSALCALGITVSCEFSSIELDKIQGPTLNNSFAFNIGNIKYTVGELVNDLEDETLEVVEGGDLSLSLVYRDTSKFDDISSFISIGNIANTDSYSPFGADIPASGSATVVNVPTKNFEFEFNPDGGEQVDSTYFKGGILQYTLSSDFDVQIDYTFTLNDVQNLESEPIVFTRTLPAGSLQDFQSRSLDGLKNVSRREGSSNIFNVSLDLTFHIPAGKSIDAANEMTLELKFVDSEFSAIFGNFGTDPVEVQRDSILISAFDEFNEGGLAFKNPSITMDFKNTYGIELGIELGGVVAVNSDDTEKTLTGDVVTSPQFVEAPNNTQLGESISSSFSIDNTNSNIDELLNTTPNKIIFDVTAIPNTAGSDNLNNFLFDSSYLEIMSTIEIPLDFRMDGFSKEFDLSVSGSDLEDADSLKINIDVINEIPFDGLLDLSFQDSEGNVLYLLEEIAVITAPPIGTEGRVVEPISSRSSIALNEEGIEAFLQSSSVIATMNIFTLGNEGGDFVKIFSDYQLEIYLSAEGKVSVDL
ncbi:hypothetical protein [Ekhidna sp.]|uniref:hypothetical protein n=1 Tax=Ekhidna sp. TaxID=2608089 RepID=UPI003297DCAD